MKAGALNSADGEIGQLLLQSDIDPVVDGASFGEIHYVHAQVGVKPGKHALRAGRAAGDLCWRADAGTSVSRKRACWTKFRNHAADLSCAGRAAVRDLRGVTIKNRIAEIESAGRAAVIYVDSEQGARAHVTLITQGEHQSRTQLVLHAGIYLQRAGRPKIREQQAQAILIRTRECAGIPDEAGVRSRA